MCEPAIDLGIMSNPPDASRHRSRAPCAGKNSIRLLSRER
jgi:hypothetical protein